MLHISNQINYILICFKQPHIINKRIQIAGIVHNRDFRISDH